MRRAGFEKVFLTRETGFQDDNEGIELRDYFAAAAATGILAAQPDYKPAQVAEAAYQVAGQMMARRKKA